MKRNQIAVDGYIIGFQSCDKTTGNLFAIKSGEVVTTYCKAQLPSLALDSDNRWYRGDGHIDKNCFAELDNRYRHEILALADRLN